MDLSPAPDGDEFASDAICEDAGSAGDFEAQLEDAVAAGRERLLRQNRSRGRPTTASLIGGSSSSSSRPNTAALIGDHHHANGESNKSLRGSHSASTNTFEDNSAKRVSSRGRLRSGFPTSKRMPRPASAGCLRAGSAKNLRRPVSAFSRGFGVGLNTGSVSAVGSEAKLVGDAVRGKSISRGQQEASRRPKSVVEFMRMHEAKHRRDEQRLAALIERTNHEAEFALLRKMTELNQVVESERQSGEAIVYKMLDGSRKGERVGCYVGAELVGKMSVEAFRAKVGGLGYC
ncbi:hypothetical protein FOZ60_013102 [Perkinsus olseni]|uniref:Uncharacterized protein n=1 Tax=Perkinsus olseni TaxID=32597 RepID=A0A7J6NAC5_PEROL|nr:hypothetical protein FOZ60_013102 [Perkinsus olseni]